MTKTYPVTKKARAANLTSAMRKDPPTFRFTKGMAAAASKLEGKSTRGKKRNAHA